MPLGPFSTELMRDQHMMTSRLDSRFFGYQLDAGATNTSFDYSNANIEDCFLTAFEAYVRNDLNYKNDSLYYVAGNAPPWSGEYNTVVNLEDGFAKNPHMHLTKARPPTRRRAWPGMPPMRPEAAAGFGSCISSAIRSRSAPGTLVRQRGSI